MLRKPKALIALAALALGVALNVQAALLGAVQSYPDITLGSNSYIVYDYNGANGKTGTLYVVTLSDTLNASAGVTGP